MNDKYEWKVGDLYDVVERYGKGRIVYRAVVARLTKTQVLACPEGCPGQDTRFQRDTACKIDAVYGDRMLVPVPL